MILIAAYWLLLFPLFLVWGTAADSLFKTKASHPALVALLGIFPLTAGFTLTAFLLPLGPVSLALWLILTLITVIAFRSTLVTNLNKIKIALHSLSGIERLFLTAIALCVLFKSAQLPSLIDNQTYYVPTIKWLNEYGLVKGIANLHLFLGQQSPWHIVQAGLNLSFTGHTFNDLNGFLLVIFSWYVVSYILRNETTTWFSYTLLALPLLLLFVDSPSPDLPVIVYCIIAFYLLSSEPGNEYHYRLAWCFLLLAGFIKITAAPLALILLLYPKPFKRNLGFVLSTAVPLNVLWLAKNYIATGHPLYPFTFDSLSAAWAVPDTIIRGIHHTSNAYVYGTSSNDILTKIQLWLTPDSVRGWINVAIIFLFVITPFFRAVRGNYFKIYIISLLHFIILLIVSPQVRFMLPELIFFGAVIATQLFYSIKEPRKQAMILSASFLLALPFIIWHGSSGYIVLPASQTAKPTMKFKECLIGNLKYYSPINEDFIYTCGNGPLPCVNEKQIDYIRAKYGYVPQLAGENVAKGFVSKKAE